MTGGIEFVNLDVKYADEAYLLAKAEYDRAKENMAVIDCEGAEANLEKTVRTVFEHGVGKVAVKDGKVVGYAGYYAPINGFHGDVNGAFSPLGASAVTSKEISGIDRGKLVELLLTTSLRDLVNNGVFCIGFSSYSCDKELLASLVLNGFGVRRCDAVTEAEKLCGVEYKYPIKELTGEEKRTIIPLYHNLNEYLSTSPMFMPNMEDPAIYDEWVSDDERRIFAMYDGDEPVGFVCAKPDAENYISSCGEVANMCGFYVLPEYRRHHVAEQLVSFLAETFVKEGYKKIGVDYETINPSALRFYNKFFTPYTYTLVRRIDERVVG